MIMETKNKGFDTGIASEYLVLSFSVFTTNYYSILYK